MVLQSKSEPIGARFGAYVAELHEFFQSREVHFGNPHDLVAFVAKVEGPGPFGDEMGSMVRSIVFQEHESLSRVELLELVTTAVGGPAIETGSLEVQAAVRRISAFLNESVGEQGRAFGARLEEDGHITAGDVLAAATQERTGGRSVTGRSPENGRYGQEIDAWSQADREPEEYSSSRSPIAGSGMLYRAVSMSDEEEAEAGLRRWEGSRRRRWLVPALLALVIVLVMGGYLIRPLLDRSGNRGVAVPVSSPNVQAVVPGSCTASALPNTSRASLSQRAMWAHRLLNQKLYAAALPELQSIAQADPAFPGVHLDESDALLNLKRPEDAREAVDTQIGISECLAKLPAPSLDKYCAAEFPVALTATCRPELTRIREAAQLQAAMVHLELGHRIEPEGGAAVAEDAKAEAVARSSKASLAPQTTVSRPRHAAPLPAATEGDTARPNLPSVASKGKRKAEGDESLIKGEGTDSSLGAYSKPQ